MEGKANCETELYIPAPLDLIDFTLLAGTHSETAVARVIPVCQIVQQWSREVEAVS